MSCLKKPPSSTFRQLAVIAALGCLLWPAVSAAEGTRKVIENGDPAQCCPPEGPCYTSSNDVTRMVSVPMNSRICWPKGGNWCAGDCKPDFIAVCSDSGWWKPTTESCAATPESGAGEAGGPPDEGAGGGSEGAGGSAGGQGGGIYGARSPYANSPYRQNSPYGRSEGMGGSGNLNSGGGTYSDGGFVVPDPNGAGSWTAAQKCAALRAQIDEARRYMNAVCPYASQSSTHRTACQAGKTALKSNEDMYRQTCF